MSRYRPYPAYKDSGVEWLGEVPEHWDVLPLKRIAHNNLSNVDKLSVDGEQSIRLCNYVDVYKNDRITADMEFMSATASDEQIKRLSIRRGDVIITKDSETPDDIGVPAFVADDMNGVVCGYHMALLRPYSDISVGAYLSRLLTSTYVRAQFATSAVGMTRFGLGKYDIENVPLPVPPTGDQASIATFLDRETIRLDTLIAKQEKLIEVLQEKRQVLISHAVTKGLNPDVMMKDSGVKWLRKMPAHWKILRIKSLATFITSGPRGWSERTGDLGCLFIQSGDLDDTMQIRFHEAKRVEVLEDAETERTELHTGDVIVCITGAKTGNVAVCNFLPERAFINQHLCLVRPGREIASAYLGLALKSKIGSTYFDLSQYGLKQGLSLEDIKEAPVPLPPTDEQAEITRFLDRETAKLDALIEKSRRFIDLLREHRTALISAAVTGKIDVRQVA